jgi:hypothetical protein
MQELFEGLAHVMILLGPEVCLPWRAISLYWVANVV